MIQIIVLREFAGNYDFKDISMTFSLKAIFQRDERYEGVRRINIYLLRLLYICLVSRAWAVAPLAISNGAWLLDQVPRSAFPPDFDDTAFIRHNGNMFAFSSNCLRVIE